MGYNGNLNAIVTEVITTEGDLRRGDSSGNPERLAIGSSGQLLQSNGTTESWATVSTADSILTTQGDVLYESASGLARLGQSTDGFVLTTKGAGANPVWASVSSGGASTAIVQSQSNFSTTSTSEVDITNYSMTLPTVAGSDNCFLIMVGTMARGAVSDAYYYGLIQDTTTVTSTTCEPTNNGYNENFSMNTIIDADGTTCKAVMSVAGGNSGTFKSGGTLNSAMSAFAV